jgi:valyl-tRNA synthetase
MVPFITEELWHKLPQKQSFLAGAPWPRCDESLLDPATEQDVELLKEAAVKIRNLRAEHNIDASRRIEVLLSAEDDAVAGMLRSQADLLGALVRASSVRVVDAIETPIAARGTIPGLQLAVPLEGLLDLDAERARLRKDLKKVEGELESRSRKLNNPSFLERAPAEVVAKERRLHQELAERRQRLEQHLATLG